MNNHNFYITNCDTDSISFRKEDNSEFTEEEQKSLIKEINSLLPSMIEYEDDGYFEHFLVIKAKNYVIGEKGKDKLKYKGSSITDTKKELALREMLNEFINDIIYNESNNLVDIYTKYIKEAYNIQDISRWVTKKSITKAVLNPSRTNEQKVLDAVKHKNIQEGDKVYLFCDIDGQKQKVVKEEPVFLKDGTPKMIDNTVLKLQEDWDGSYDKMHYIKRVKKTLEILSNVLDMSQFIRYDLKSNKKLLEELYES